MAMSLSNEVKALLDGPNFVHLATLMPDGSPHSVPVWVGREGDRILICTGEGSLKAKNTQPDPRVALSIVDFHDPYQEAQLPLRFKFQSPAHKRPCGKRQTAFPNAYEVKALSPHHRFVIALHSPKRVAETGLCVRPPEKNAGKPACGFDGTLSPVLFEGKTCRIAAIFSDSSSGRSRIDSI